MELVEVQIVNHEALALWDERPHFMVLEHEQLISRVPSWATHVDHAVLREIPRQQVTCGVFVCQSLTEDKGAAGQNKMMGIDGLGRQTRVSAET